MANHNLFVAYDLIRPVQNYDRVEEAIQALGQWHKFQFSLYYVSTPLSAQEAYSRVRLAMDGNDKLAVINALGGVVSSGDKPLIDAINAIWFTP